MERLVLLAVVGPVVVPHRPCQLNMINELHIRAFVDFVGMARGKVGNKKPHRPARLHQLTTNLVAIWDDVLPPLPEELWRENLEAVRTALG